MEFWTRSLRIFKCLCDHGPQSIRHLAQQTGIAKSSVHRLRLQHYVGCSPTALRGVIQTLERTIVETAHVWEQEGATPDEDREIIAAVDETFLEHMLLVCMDLPSGYLLVEEVAADHTYVTWKAVMDERLQALGATVFYLVSDRAKALIQLNQATQHWHTGSTRKRAISVFP